ncbi:MAG TPA: GNAT family N-acetyltransferase [Archangium sp.]|uniref:GNAT family N-acetyltransferase n=1 Tax=Archangium sp. TaxID=1872627 RepID=UPI002E33096A|nr:GNAT family N-acetyltransferase [Archangium sp.]HEX5747809.1 GNAT family N-acetyltransferase [Archangium sp.]
MDALDAVKMTVVEEPSEEELRTLIRSLVRYNETRAAPEKARDLAVFIRSEDGSLLGGAMGYTHWEWLFVSHLWVDERLRGQGWGGRLMASIEDAAVRRGCHSAHLDTFSFQALGFYEKQGYTRFGTLPDYPRGESRYFLNKRLTK